MIVRLAGTFRRRILALFTSRDMLRRVFEASAPAFLEMGLPLLAQDISGTGYFLLEEMKRREGAVLLGTSAFWEGIDLPGDSLEILIVVRLPFAVPTDPMVAARSEKCEAQDKSAFGHLALPEAVIKFRQGVGRLIRRRDDRGAALVLDGRLIEKPYGRVFARSVDSELRAYGDRDKMFADIGAFFKKA
jgi:ATP-dependent DNA helicase DinG